jgi:hypothetical protein
MPKVKLNKPNKISRKVPKIPNNLSKRLLYHKNLSLSKSRKRFSNGQAQMLKARHKMQKSISRKDLRMQDKALKKLQDTKDQNCNKQNKTLPRDCKIQRRALRTHMTQQLKS